MILYLKSICKHRILRSSPTPRIGVVKLVEDLDFAERRHIIQQVVDKVVATKKEVTVCGFIPVLAVQQVGLNGKHRNCWPAKRR